MRRAIRESNRPRFSRLKPKQQAKILKIFGKAAPALKIIKIAPIVGNVAALADFALSLSECDEW
jgi:hypothetical protein